jgi:tRNA 2-selenouridine synthase
MILKEVLLFLILKIKLYRIFFMNSDITETKALFDYVLKFDLNNIPPLDSILGKYHFDFISAEELLNHIYSGDNILIIDARSEKEFEETHIPDSVNFPVLKNKERHNVGLIYKRYSPVASIRLATEYADPKLTDLNDTLKTLKAGSKKIIVHCWRGGGRSKYFSKMIIDCGYKPVILEGGIKSYRRAVNEFFAKEFPCKLIELSGLTGTGKTELLKAVSDEIPVIDLEHSARHFSSLFGDVPYKIRKLNPVVNQSAFENDIFGQVITQQIKLKNYNFFLIESESKKVGDFFIPQNIYSRMLDIPTINVYRNIDVRISHIINDYFGTDNRGLKDMLRIFVKKEAFFRKELSNKIYDFLLNCLLEKDTYLFTKMMINEYYDKKYRDKGKTPIASICTDDIPTAKKELINFLRSINK